MLTKNRRYYFNSKAIKEPAVSGSCSLRNRRDVWSISTKPHKDAHVAMFPEELPRLCIKAGSKKGQTVLDPFAGSGTTGMVADELGRNCILIEVSSEYVEEIKKRLNVCQHVVSKDLKGDYLSKVLYAPKVKGDHPDYAISCVEPYWLTTEGDSCFPGQL
jgi:DNA modification methylase